MITRLPHQSFALVLLLLLVVSTTADAQQNPHELFQQARMFDESNQNLTEAIALYRQVATLSTDQRKLAAEAQLSVGLLYERLGQTAQAQQAYAAVLDEYADQTEVARQAQVRMLASREQAQEASDIVIRRVWAGRQLDRVGSPSPDGRYLTFIDWGAGGKSYVAIHDLATGNNRRLTGAEQPAFGGKFSPDGEYVAYSSFNRDLFFDLRVVGLQDPNSRIIYSNSNQELEYIVVTGWSPDGKHVLATFARKDRTAQIVLVSVEDGSLQVLKTLDWRYPFNMSLSPDGRYVVYAFPSKEDAPERDIFLLSTDGSREIPLIEHAASDYRPVWAPDGRTVVFLSDRMGSIGVWSIQVVAGKPEGIPQLLKKSIEPGSGLIGFTRNGSLYYSYRSEIDKGDVYTATLDIAAGKVLVAPTPVSERYVGSNTVADWSPDGKYLSYVSQRGPGTSRSIVIRTVETGEEREMPLTVGQFVTWPRWSPNGASFLVAGRHKKAAGLYQVDAEGGDVTRIVSYEGIYGISRWAWSPDGKAVFFDRNDMISKTQTLVWRDLETGQERIIESHAINSEDSNIGLLVDIQLSPTGQQLALVRNRQDPPSMVIQLIPVAGGELHEILSVERPEYIYGGLHREALAWTPDGRYLLFGKARSGDEDQTVELWRIPVEGGEPQNLGLAMPNLRDLRIHPDGQRIAFTAGMFGAEVWVMEDFLPEDEGTR